MAIFLVLETHSRMDVDNHSENIYWTYNVADTVLELGVQRFYFWELGANKHKH